MDYKYDIAISYQSELTENAEKIIEYLQSDNWHVFYAPIQQQELVSEKLHQKLYEVYKNESLLKVLLITETYLTSEWTLLEKRMSLESTKKEKKRLIIVNFTGEALPGELKPFVYLDGTKLHADEIAAFISERLKELVEHKEPSKSELNRGNQKEGSSSVIHNHGIIAGDNAQFGDIHLG